MDTENKDIKNTVKEKTKKINNKISSIGINDLIAYEIACSKVCSMYEKIVRIDYDDHHYSDYTEELNYFDKLYRKIIDAFEIKLKELDKEYE